MVFVVFVGFVGQSKADAGLRDEEKSDVGGVLPECFLKGRLRIVPRPIPAGDRPDPEVDKLP